MSTWKQRLSLALCTLLVAAAATADIPGDLDDLINARASSGERALVDRGYVYIDHGRMEGHTWNYWWNQSKRACVAVMTDNGRYERIASVSSSDCNQASGHHEDRDGMSDGAKVAIGAAAILGAIALAHKSHDHDDFDHYDDVNREAEFDRGYRDGQYHHSFNNYNHSQDYEQGFERGSDSRAHHSSYQQHDYDNHNRHGYSGKQRYEDLVGERARSADSALQQRGFDNVDGFKSGNTSYTIWWNDRSRQCLQMATANGRADSITDIHRHPGCH